MNLPQRQSARPFLKYITLLFCSFALYLRVVLLGAGKWDQRLLVMEKALCVFCSFCEGPEAVSVEAVDMEV